MRKISKVKIRLNIPAEEYLRYYRGGVNQIVGPDISGQVIRFPANRVQQFVTHDGIQGLFEISFDENNKFVDIKKIS